MGCNCSKKKLSTQGKKVIQKIKPQTKSITSRRLVRRVSH
jgi:hypothetical protein